MQLLIHLGADEVILKLVDSDHTIDVIKVSYYHDLSNKLITGLDKLLRKNRMKLTLIKACKIEGNLGSDATSYKVAEAFGNSLTL